MGFEYFQDSHTGVHLGYLNRTIFAILNLYVAPMSPIKFRLNPTYDLGGNIVQRISRRLPWQPSWISERNYFSNSKSPYSQNASLQVWDQSDLEFKSRCGLTIFKLAADGTNLAKF